MRLQKQGAGSKAIFADCLQMKSDIVSSFVPDRKAILVRIVNIVKETNQSNVV